MKLSLATLRRIYCATLLQFPAIPGCVTAPIEFGEVDFQIGEKVLFYGGYLISPATSSTAIERKKLRIRFYNPGQSKPAVLFERTYAIEADSNEVLRRYSRDPVTIEIQVKNHNGTVAFHQFFGLVDGKPAEIKSDAKQ